MAMLADLLQGTLSKKRTLPPNNDKRMELLPLEGEKSGKVEDPDIMQQRKKIVDDPNNIFDDKGSITGYSWTNPFQKMMDKSAPQGTLRNFLGRIAGGDGDKLSGGTDPSNFLDNQTLSQNQKQSNLASTSPSGDPVPLPVSRPPSAPTVDYSQPTALDPQSIEEIRQSLMTAAGQMDPNNPNGLSGRMNSPNSNAEISNQMDETQQMGNQLRGEANSLQADRNNN